MAMDLPNFATEFEKIISDLKQDVTVTVTKIVTDSVCREIDSKSKDLFRVFLRQLYQTVNNNNINDQPGGNTVANNAEENSTEAKSAEANVNAGLSLDQPIDEPDKPDADAQQTENIQNSSLSKQSLPYDQSKREDISLEWGDESTDSEESEYSHLYDLPQNQELTDEDMDEDVDEDMDEDDDENKEKYEHVDENKNDSMDDDKNKEKDEHDENKDDNMDYDKNKEKDEHGDENKDDDKNKEKFEHVDENKNDNMDDDKNKEKDEHGDENKDDDKNKEKFKHVDENKDDNMDDDKNKEKDEHEDEYVDENKNDSMDDDKNKEKDDHGDENQDDDKNKEKDEHVDENKNDSMDDEDEDEDEDYEDDDDDDEDYNVEDEEEDEEDEEEWKIAMSSKKKKPRYMPQFEQAQKKQFTEHSNSSLDKLHKYRTINLACTFDNCILVFSTQDLLDKHLLLNHNVLPFLCLLKGCNQEFPNKPQLTEHTLVDHSKVTEWECSRCESKLNNYKNLHNHMLNFHYTGQFECGKEGCHFQGNRRLLVLNHYNKAHM